MIADRIPEILGKAVEEYRELMAPRPEIISPAADAASGLTIVQSIIGLTCATCLSLALLALNRYGRLNTPPEI